VDLHVVAVPLDGHGVENIVHRSAYLAQPETVDVDATAGDDHRERRQRDRPPIDQVSWR
jgi:hypothetical protein